MKKIRNFLVCLLLCICALCVYVGCNGGSSAKGVTGIEDGYIYVIELGDIAAEFETGSATISKDGGEAIAYESGTLITEAGEYVLIWSKGSDEITYTFTVRHETPDAPVVSGVTDGEKIEYGNSVSPTFDKGTATLSKDGGIAVPYTQGTAISEVGIYLLEVTFESVSTKVNFEITLPNYAGEMTDEFVGGVLSGGYITSDGILSIEGEALRIYDKEDAQGWAIVRRQFQGVDVNTNPYVEFDVTALQNVSIKFSVGLEQYIGATAELPVEVTRAYAPGKAYVNVKKVAEDAELDLSNANLWLQIAIEGQKFADGELTALIESIKSVSEIPQEVAASQYVDNTAESLNAWVANTAKLTYFDGNTFALGTIVDPENGYGKFVKRVQFNTVEYPYLTVDVQDVVDGWKIEALTYENNVYVGNRIALFDQSSKTGVSEINLQNVFGLDECVDVVLEFYIVGKSDDKFFALNGLTTSAEPYYAPIITGIGEGSIHNVAANGALSISFDKGTATLTKKGGEPVEYVKGTQISEVGEYTLTVSAGTETVKTSTVNFMVIDQAYEQGVIEDYLNKSKFTVENGTYEIVQENQNYVAKITKPKDGAMLKLVSRMDIDFTQNTVLKWVFETEGFTYDAGLNLEILDDVAWFRVMVKQENANFIESETLENGRTRYTVYYKVDKANYTGTGKEPVTWTGTAKTNLKMTISLEFGGEKSVYLTSLALVNTYPDEGVELPVVTGVLSGATHNLAKDGELVVSFDNGVATLSKDGAEGVAFTSGTQITEVGSYVLTVKAGISKITTVTFTVIDDAEVEEPEDEPIVEIGSIVDDYNTVDGYATAGGTSTYNAAKDEVVLTKADGQTATFAKDDFTFDFKANGNYIVFVFETEDYTPDAGFSIEILDNSAWYRIVRAYAAGNKTPFEYIQTETLESGRTRHTCYIKVTDALKTDSTQAPINWASTVKTGLKITVMIEYGGEKTVYLKYLSITNTMPEGVKAGLVDDYKTADFTIDKTNSTAVYDADKDEIVLTKANGEDVKFQKKYTFDFATNGNYLVLEFETQGYTPDTGFVIEMLDDVNWYATKYRDSDESGYNRFAKIAITDLGNGRKLYTMYMLIGDANHTGGNGSTTWAGTTVTAKLGISIWWGGEKSIYLKQLYLTKSLPDESIVDDYTTADFEISASTNSTAVYDSAKDEVILTKAADQDPKFSKRYEFDFATNGNYLVLEFETQGYTPDAGFVIEILDDVNWYQIKYDYTTFTKVVTEDLGNGRTLYTCYMEIADATHTGGNGTTTWADTEVSAKFTIFIQYGAEKVVYAKSLYITDALPTEV